ncbi:uncharacterized protein TNCV_689661 [Trichonephila clavipes]|nr:uncharacterized protein TNCV_689661 [Trichonephila clavipes]
MSSTKPKGSCYGQHSRNQNSTPFPTLPRSLARQLIDGYSSRKRKGRPTNFQAKKYVVPDDVRLTSVGNHMPKMISNYRRYGDRFNSCQVIYSQFGLAIRQNDHQARRRFVEWAQNEIAVVPDFHKRILFSDEAHFWFNGYVNKQNCRIWSEANPQVYVETPLHPEKLTVWCALWAGGILLQKR